MIKLSYYEILHYKLFLFSPFNNDHQIDTSNKFGKQLASNKGEFRPNTHLYT